MVRRVLFLASISRFRLPLIAAVAVLFFIYALMLAPPLEFPSGSIITIPRGATLSETARALQSEQVVRSAFILRLGATFFGGDSAVQAGQYQFNAPRNAFRIARALVSGDFGFEYVGVTVPEGATVADIAEIFDRKNFPEFDEQAFRAAALKFEGYLFPDTYKLSPATTAEDVTLLMQQNFLKKISSVQDELLAFRHPLRDVVIMASLLEKEARSLEVRRTIAGILWKRLKLGMPLQVDAVFGYINERDTYSPSLEDLQVDSPYNTYRNKGLPPGPIANPGLEAIIAAVTPIESEYLYYLTDREGIMRYATTYEGHLANKRKYLP